ncbi:MAG: hypothetical protein OXN17_07260 [Candidatus Poribacteria bacterium]|nr:hypothetical protein [Candidatus Poribacteria bacterium]
MILARDWSVPNNAIFCEYNFDPFPRSAEETAEKPRQARLKNIAQMGSFATQDGAAKGQDKLNSIGGLDADSTFWFVVISYLHAKAVRTCGRI